VEKKEVEKKEVEKKEVEKKEMEKKEMEKKEIEKNGRGRYTHLNGDNVRQILVLNLNQPRTFQRKLVRLCHHYTNHESH
jgi:hypothetical protein